MVYKIIGSKKFVCVVTEDGIGKTSLTGIPVGPDFSGMEKMWRTFSALGDVAFAYSFCFVLIEIQVAHV